MPLPGNNLSMTMIRPGDYIPTGHFFDGEQQIFHDGRGNFHVAGAWYFHPELVVGMPPPPPTLAEKMNMERQRLSTPWPKYGDAWAAAKADRAFCRFYAMFGLPLSLFGMVHFFSLVNGDMYFRPFFAALFCVAVYPFAWWRVYHRFLGKVDRHKQVAFGLATYGALTAGSYAARRHGERHPPTSLGVPDGHGHWKIPPG